MKYIVICLLWISLLLILLILSNIYRGTLIETFIDGNNDLETVKFPFKNIKTENNKNTNVIGIVAPFRNKDHFDQTQEYVCQDGDIGYILDGKSCSSSIQIYQITYQHTQDHRP